MSPDWQNHLELISCITKVVLTMACCHGGGFMWLPIITKIGDKLEILTDLKKCIIRSFLETKTLYIQ
jgi:hypothetical protein